MKSQSSDKPGLGHPNRLPSQSMFSTEIPSENGTEPVEEYILERPDTDWHQVTEGEDTEEEPPASWRARLFNFIAGVLPHIAIPEMMQGFVDRHSRRYQVWGHNIRVLWHHSWNSTGYTIWTAVAALFTFQIVDALLNIGANAIARDYSYESVPIMREVLTVMSYHFTTVDYRRNRYLIGLIALVINLGKIIFPDRRGEPVDEFVGTCRFPGMQVTPNELSYLNTSAPFSTRWTDEQIEMMTKMDPADRMAYVKSLNTDVDVDESRLIRDDALMSINARTYTSGVRDVIAFVHRQFVTVLVCVTTLIIGAPVIIRKIWLLVWHLAEAVISAVESKPQITDADKAKNKRVHYEPEGRGGPRREKKYTPPPSEEAEARDEGAPYTPSADVEERAVEERKKLQKQFKPSKAASLPEGEKLWADYSDSSHSARSYSGSDDEGEILDFLADDYRETEQPMYDNEGAKVPIAKRSHYTRESIFGDGILAAPYEHQVLSIQSTDAETSETVQIADAFGVGRYVVTALHAIIDPKTNKMFPNLTIFFPQHKARKEITMKFTIASYSKAGKKYLALWSRDDLVVLMPERALPKGVGMSPRIIDNSIESIYVRLSGHIFAQGGRQYQPNNGVLKLDHKTRKSSHTIDTTPGTSGAPLTVSTGHVIGVHLGGARGSNQSNTAIIFSKKQLCFLLGCQTLSSKHVLRTC
jgi:hypothetical protein